MMTSLFSRMMPKPKPASVRKAVETPSDLSDLVSPSSSTPEILAPVLVKTISRSISEMSSIHLEILSVGDVQKYDLVARVCLVMTCPLDVEGEAQAFMFKNSRSVVKEILPSGPGTQCVHYDMELYLVNNTEYIPFNRQYLEIVVCHPFFEGGVKLTTSLPYGMRDVLTGFEIETSDTISSCVWEYINVSPVEHILKYMLVPYLLTIMQQLTHTVKGENGIKGGDGKGDWVGICATFMLSDIALFFTIPTTIKMTCLERSLFLNFFLKFIIAMFAFYDFDVDVAHMFSSNDNFHHVVDWFNTGVITISVVSYCTWLWLKSRYREDNRIQRGGNRLQRVKRI